MCIVLFFFFKQKTAYEMRISDWSSDVCSSDLIGGTGNLQKLGAGTLTLTGANTYGNTQVQAGTLVGNAASIRGDLTNNGSVVFNQASDEIGRASCRERVCQYV